MARGSNQKLKLLYLLKILEEETDEQHGLTMSQIVEKLKAYDVIAERKSLYDDIEELRKYEIDIIGEKEHRSYKYYMGKRKFELAELKLLVDAVQSSKFITEKKSNELIRKLEKSTSKYQASYLQRQVFVADRVKTMNENIYYNVDGIHQAINRNRQISFDYYVYRPDKSEVKRRESKYVVSPWALLWDDANYYLIAYDNDASKMKHYRVDKMKALDECEETRLGREVYEQFNLASYSKKMFNMFAGIDTYVKMQFKNGLSGVVIDRFGKDVGIKQINEEYFEINVEVSVSKQFLGWVIGLSDGAKIIGPQYVLDMMRDEIMRLSKIYM